MIKANLQWVIIAAECRLDPHVSYHTCPSVRPESVVYGLSFSSRDRIIIARAGDALSIGYSNSPPYEKAFFQEMMCIGSANSPAPPVLFTYPGHARTRIDHHRRPGRTPKGINDRGIRRCEVMICNGLTRSGGASCSRILRTSQPHDASSPTRLMTLQVARRGSATGLCFPLSAGPVKSAFGSRQSPDYHSPSGVIGLSW